MRREKFPVLLTFDIDGQTTWTSRDATNADRPVTLSLGNYGPESGMPRILKLLRDYKLPATFFIPGLIAEKYPEMVKEADRDGHEIGNHSFYHTWPDQYGSKEKEYDDYSRANEVLKKLTGKTPKGYRSPAWEFSPHTIAILEEMGFLYSSNMMNTDRITRLETYGKKHNLVEIPIHWILDDAAFWIFSTRMQGKAIQPLSSVYEMWTEEFQGLYEETWNDNVFCLTCHPQVIGRPSRIRLLERLIRFIMGHPGVEFLTCGQIAEEYKDKVFV